MEYYAEQYAQAREYKVKGELSEKYAQAHAWVILWKLEKQISVDELQNVKFPSGGYLVVIWVIFSFTACLKTSLNPLILNGAAGEDWTPDLIITNERI